MKKLILLFFLCFTSNLFAQIERGIDFIRGTLENAQKLAEQQHKLVFISYENYGGNSRWMNQNVFSTPESGEYFNENFISLKINSESLRDKASNSDFKYRGLSSAYFFFTSKGELINKSKRKFPFARKIR
jgi:thioredoxin-related protein